MKTFFCAPRRASNSAFTLIELLVVVAIIAILAAILFPVFAQARGKARAINSLSNSRQAALGISMYITDNDESLPLNLHARPTGWVYGNPDPSWIDAVQPYVKSKLLTRLPDDNSDNWPEMIDLAALAPGKTPRLSSYATNAYLNNNKDGTGWTLSDITRPAELIYVGEYRESKPGAPKTGDHLHPMCWEGFPASTCVSLASNDEVEKTRYQGGANYTFVDGHAKWQKFEQTYNPAQARDWYIPNQGAAAQYNRTYWQP
jgi:prepilin-type N-terminal cleavage/methylation domain-containing protein/prepilin-type processing-associated H-X9-DG protein